VNEPRVSVIVIFFNEERFLGEAVDSVLAQDFDDYELLLVDDGSSDASTRIAREYAERHPGRVSYLEHENHINRGMSAARNLGLARARGELIAFIDADDRWRATKLSEQVVLMDAHPEIGLLCGQVNYWRSWEGGADVLTPTGHVQDGISFPPRTSLALYPLGGAHAPCPSDVMVRKSVALGIGGFDERFTGLYEDQIFFSRIYLAAPVYFSSRVWIDYRIHDASCVSRTHREGKYANVRREFLRTFRSSVEASDTLAKERVLQAIDRAEWRLNHPTAARVLSRFSLALGAES
jgi:glycosyltransferase involved in cell wall biosynthesis